MGIEELHENIGGIVNYYGGTSFGLTLSYLVLACPSKEEELRVQRTRRK
jgi:hypothetical protein